jgi:hypothetical protein
MPSAQQKCATQLRNNRLLKIFAKTGDLVPE